MSQHCRGDALEKIATAEEHRNLDSALLVVEGMGCPNCAARVRNSLLSLKGVVEAQIALEMGVAEVTFNSELVTLPALLDAVARAGGDGRHTYRAQTWDEASHPAPTLILLMDGP